MLRAAESETAAADAGEGQTDTRRRELLYLTELKICHYNSIVILVSIVRVNVNHFFDGRRTGVVVNDDEHNDENDRIKRSLSSLSSELST